MTGGRSRGGPGGPDQIPPDCPLRRQPADTRNIERLSDIQIFSCLRSWSRRTKPSLASSRPLPCWSGPSPKRERHAAAERIAAMTAAPHLGRRHPASAVTVMKALSSARASMRSRPPATASTGETRLSRIACARSTARHIGDGVISPLLAVEASPASHHPPSAVNQRVWPVT